MSLSPPLTQTEGCVHVCKKCDFSSTDSEILCKHQATEHVEQCELQLDSEPSLETHRQEQSEPLVTYNTTEEPTRVHSEEETSEIEKNVMSVGVTTMQLSPGQNGLTMDGGNNNEIVSKTAFLENNPGYPGSNDVSNDVASTSPTIESVSNVTVNNSGFVRGRKSQKSSTDLENPNEGHNRKLDAGDDNEVELVIDEDVNENNGQNSLEHAPVPYIDIKPLDESSPVQLEGTRRPPFHFSPNAFSLINPKIFSTSSTDALKNAINYGRTSEKTISAKESTSSSNITPPRRCAPVREAVDPAKYITVQEGDGIKFACSKCGNIYKWRKSLNKHWKEKHDGEIPEPRTSQTIPIPRPIPNSYPRYPSQQATHRQPKTSPVKPDLSYLRSLGISSPYGKIDNPFDAMRPGSLKSSPSQNRRASVSSLNAYYSRNQDTALKRPYPTSTILDNIIKQQQQMFPRFPSASTASSPSPPPAHTATSIRRRAVDTPVDLTRELSGAQESPLDLSINSSLLTSQTPQDEPLDFSKPIAIHGKTEPAKPVMLNPFSSPKQEVGFIAYKQPMMVSPVKENIPKAKQCRWCNYIAPDEQDMAAHAHLHTVQTVHTAQEIACAECQEPFPSIDDLNEHFVLRHTQVLAKRVAQIRCENATTATEGGDKLYKYLTQGPNKPISSCFVCGQLFQFQFAIARHFEQEHGKFPNPYQLADSPDTTESPSPRDIEPLAIVEAGMMYRCSQCPYTTATTSDLARHQIRHSLNKHHVCKVCGYTAKAREELMEHYETDHPSVQPADLKPSTGTVMLAPGEDSDDSQSESTHIIGPDGKYLIDIGGDGNTAIVYPEAPDDPPRVGRKPNTASSVDVLLPYKCSVCEYRARWPSEITQHMKNHSDEKPFRCPRCTYKSKWKWDVVKHLKRCGGGTVKDVIDITKLPPFIFTHSHSPENLAPAHARELSNGPPNVTVVRNMDQPPYSMDYSPNDGEMDLDVDGTSQMNQSLKCIHSKCTFVASNANDMRKHSKFHTYEVQQVYCSQCPFKGNNPAELKRHLRVHSDEKPFICKTCGYSSKWKCDLKKHCRTYTHLPAVPLTYGGHGRKPQGNHADGSEPGTSDDQNASEYDSADTEYNGDLSVNQSESGDPIENDHNATALQFKCTHCDYEGHDLVSFTQHKLIHPDTPDETTDVQAADDARMEPNGTSSNRRKQSKQSIMKNKFDFATASDSPQSLVDNSSTYQSYNNENPTDLSVEKSRSSPADLSMANKSFPCPKCPYSTNNYQNYERHLPTHGKPDAKYTCEWCSWSSEQMYMLYRHAQASHAAQLLDTDMDTFCERVKARALYDHAPSWTQSQRYPSPTISPAVSPVTGKPMYSEGKKTKRRLKTCVKCGYITDNVTTLQRHMAKHGKQGKYVCTYCDYSVDKQHVVDYHMRRVHGTGKTDSQNQSPLPIASLIEPDNTSSSTVELNDNYTSSLDNLCAGEQEIVDFKNVDVSNLKGEDVKIVHIGNRTVYGCAKCPYNTMKASSVLKHNRQHGANKRYTCTKCDYSVDHVSHVRNHMRSVHGEDGAVSRSNTPHTENQINGYLIGSGVEEAEPQPKKTRWVSSTDSPFSCGNCGFEGENMTDLVAHKCTHVQELKCEHCDYVGISSGLMKLHTKTHNIRANGKHPCDKCPYRTVSRSQLQNHKKHHGLTSKHDCPHCDYSCGNTTQKGNHVKLHFQNQHMERDTLHLLMKGEIVPGFTPQMTLSDNDLVNMDQGHTEMDFDEEQDEEDILEKTDFDLNANRPLNGQLSQLQ